MDTKINLILCHIYRFRNGQEFIFKRIGATGLPIFHPVFEPSMQDCFALKDMDQIVEHVREATPEELGI